MQFNVAITWFFNRVNAMKTGGEAEYPPSPARLLQAALAGAYENGDSRIVESVRNAIQYLEYQKPPDIHAVEPVFGTPFEHFVHNNAVKQYDSEETNTRKLLNPTLLTGSDSQVVYSWTLPDDAPVYALRTAFDALFALGHGDDMAFARTLEFFPQLSRHYLPIRGGMDAFLNVPRSGFVTDLDVAYRNQDRNEIMNIHQQPYALKEHVPQLRRIACFELHQMDNEQPFAFSDKRTTEVAAWVRHAAIEALKKDLPRDSLAAIAGHANGTNAARVLYLPIPTIGPYADRLIRRVCICAPPELADSIQMMRNTLPGRILTDKEGKQRCRLIEARSNTVFERYTNASIEFETVTPAVLPHHLTKNRRLNCRRVKELGRWFVEAGLPEPVDVSVGFQNEKFFAPVYIQHLPQYRLRVRFGSEVTGPIAVGLGRFCGLGTFANLVGTEAERRFATTHNNGNLQRPSQSFSSEAVALAR